MAFKIGDVVWVRAKVWDYSRHPGRLVLEVGNGEVIANESDCKASHESDLKQAIREVLLSDEFLAAFAAAWMKTPLIHQSEMNLTIDPITGTESEAYYLDKLKKGEAK